MIILDTKVIFVRVEPTVDLYHMAGATGVPGNVLQKHAIHSGLPAIAC